MTDVSSKQLNPFELKTTISELIKNINSVDDMSNYLDVFEELENQNNTKFISKLLFKELLTAPTSKISLICFMLEHFVPKEDLVKKLWETLKNNDLQTDVKVTILNLLREWDSDWTYESCEETLGDDVSELLDENTKQLLNNAIINPEVQIDFMDFMASLNTQDKITLLGSFGEDFSSDALANILIPVFMSNPNSPEGTEALNLLADTKSQLALNVLEEMKNLTDGELQQKIKKSLSTVKISGMRQDNTTEFYRKVLSDSKPNQFYVTYPDGHGDMAMIFTRKTSDNKIRFVSIVTNATTGIKDCFGFFEISEFESSKILERFLRNEKTVSLSAETFKNILYNAELSTICQYANSWKLPYEYVCWKNLLVDIDYNPTVIEQYNKDNIATINVTDVMFDKLNDMGVLSHWFMDMDYSDEFKTLLKKIKTVDLENLVETSYNIVFSDEEKILWDKKLEICAYIKHTKEKYEDAEILYSILNTDVLKDKLYKEILKRSVYEYLMLIKYDSKVEHYSLTMDDILDKISYIEDRWIHNV